MNHSLDRHWYQEPYVWMIILIPASAVIMGIVMLSLAIVSNDGLVEDDYYKLGKNINRVLTRDITAAKMGLAAVLELDRENGKVTVLFKKNASKIRLDTLRLRLLHATRAGFDQDLTLQRLPDGRYYALFKSMAPGRWYLQLESRDWRLIGEITSPDGTLTSLLPNPV
ncbi:MAG: FixH family protein [Acidiferrobacterales bacterium]